MGHSISSEASRQRFLQNVLSRGRALINWSVQKGTEASEQPVRALLNLVVRLHFFTFLVLWLLVYGLAITTDVLHIPHLLITVSAIGVTVLLSGALWWLRYPVERSKQALDGLLTEVTTARAKMVAAHEKMAEVQQLGKYRLGELISEGGMGRIYKASHVLMKRPTAIKVLRTENMYPHSLMRFRREVEMTCRLTHHNIVEIYDFGESDTGQFYYVMEYLDGIDVELLVERYGPLSPGRTIHILLQVAAALREAHTHKLIHRDIKPGNIILCERGGIPDYVKVVDFGLVKDMDSDAHLSMHGMISGTPAYISPEAARGRPVGPRCDLYSLGAVGYYLLTGNQVFDGPEAEDYFHQHVHRPPLPVGLRAEQEVPPALDRLIMQCLAKRPGDRPPDAQALIDALTDISRQHPWDEGMAREWWADHRACKQEERRVQTEVELGSLARGPRTMPGSHDIVPDALCAVTADHSRNLRLARMRSAPDDTLPSRSRCRPGSDSPARPRTVTDPGEIPDDTERMPQMAVARLVEHQRHAS